MKLTRNRFIRLRRRLARAVSPDKNGVRRDEQNREFYPQVTSCQIPGISLLYEVFLGRRSHGTFIEIGAFDGFTYSNTWGLAERGWTGLMAEPVPEFAEKARVAHQTHSAVEVVQTAVGATPGNLDLVVSGAFTSGNSALNEEYEGVDWAQSLLGQQSVRVPVTTLSELISTRFRGPEIDVLAVDVEGYEAEVFAGFDWRIAPKMLIVELMDLHPDLKTTRSSDASLQREICQRGYQIVYKDSINTVFVADELWAGALGVDI